MSGKIQAGQSDLEKDAKMTAKKPYGLSTPRVNPKRKRIVDATPDAQREVSKKHWTTTKPVAEEAKQAEVLQARLKSFDYGMDLFFKEGGVEKTAVAQAVGLEEHTLAPHAAAWLKDYMAEANKQASAQPAAK
jgi:hypothetical protein